MPKVERHDTDALNGVLEVYLPKEEYIKDVQKEINKYSRNAQIKGFRKGKTPPSVIRGLYGQSLLMETINEKIAKTLNEYLEESGLDILGRPLASEHQQPLRLNLTDPEDLSFKFDVGYSPDFDLKGLEITDVYKRFVAEPAEAEIDKEILALRRENAVQSEAEADAGIDEDDILRLDAKEVEGETAAKFSVAVRDINDEVKAYLLGKKKGDVFRFDVFDLEKDREEEFVKYQILGLNEGEEVSREFEARIDTVTRMNLPELDEAFYQKIFGPETTVTTVEAFREEVRKIFRQSFMGYTNALLNKAIMDRLMEENDFDLPDQFLKRWLKASSEGRYTDDMIEREYPNFRKRMRWTILRQKIVQGTGLDMGEEDIKESLRLQIMSAFGGLVPFDDDIMDVMYERAKADDKHFNELLEEASTRKAFQYARAIAQTEDEFVGVETLKSMTQAAQKKAELASGGNTEGDFASFDEMVEEADDEHYAG